MKVSNRLIKKLVSIIHRPFILALDMVCPPVCAGCRIELESNDAVLCRECWQSLQDTLQDQACPVCGHSAGRYSLVNGRCHRCRNTRPVVSRVVRLGNYQTILRELILALKFRRQSRLDHFLGHLLAAAISGEREISAADMLVPIPLHWRRYWARRYNQAELLTRSTAAALHQQGIHIPVSSDLVRIRNTPPQTSLTSLTDRLANIRGAFAVRAGHNFKDKHICLIDDVTTTGTTLRVAAGTLRRAGARKISAAVLAVAAND
ncbi:MAG: ComF family protein [Sedimentisphaerales bacterium]|nr:ComF family protein [Sedimentisphaerales bacterium]